MPTLSSTSAVAAVGAVLTFSAPCGYFWLCQDSSSDAPVSADSVVRSSLAAKALEDEEVPSSQPLIAAQFKFTEPENHVVTHSRQHQMEEDGVSVSAAIAAVLFVALDILLCGLAMRCWRKPAAALLQETVEEAVVETDAKAADSAEQASADLTQASTPSASECPADEEAKTESRDGVEAAASAVERVALKKDEPEASIHEDRSATRGEIGFESEQNTSCVDEQIKAESLEDIQERQPELGNVGEDVEASEEAAMEPFPEPCEEDEAATPQHEVQPCAVFGDAQLDVEFDIMVVPPLTPMPVASTVVEKLDETGDVFGNDQLAAAPVEVACDNSVVDCAGSTNNLVEADKTEPVDDIGAGSFQDDELHPRESPRTPGHCCHSETSDAEDPTMSARDKDAADSDATESVRSRKAAVEKVDDEAGDVLAADQLSAGLVDAASVEEVDNLADECAGATNNLVEADGTEPVEDFASGIFQGDEFYPGDSPHAPDHCRRSETSDAERMRRRDKQPRGGGWDRAGGRLCIRNLPRR
eukprot:TRINITY_DN3193_c0_g1_i2.p1 TRINITY_DN3193_c0_g1~~TRINITY_DN3193_c0_g1_i2.p1  ORF type:complete len:530 (-),score=120.20 TRINITY_DN3193_c0_g1_i2:92-1681(-)